MRPEEIVAGRKRDALHHALGPDVLCALDEPRIFEVIANPDGRLIVDVQGEGRRDTGIRIGAEARERVIRLVADHVGETITRTDPRVSGVLPTGERFQGLLPPICAGPTFAIRKRPGVIWSLHDYVAQAIVSDVQAALLRRAVAARRNILISGGAGSGKTTLANALLAEPSFSGDRVFIFEDTPELQCSAWDQVSLLTRRHPQPIAMVDLVRDALRMRPDRLVVGELRDGAAALETLKAWNTGHPGGLTTIHANSAFEALARLEDLLGEVMAQPSRRAIGQAVDLVVHIDRTRQARQVQAVLEVNGLDEGGGYQLTAPA